MKIEGSRHGVGHHGSKKSEISPPTPNKKKVDFPASGWHLGRDRRLGFDTTDPSQLMQISGQTHNTHTHTHACPSFCSRYADFSVALPWS